MSGSEHVVPSRALDESRAVWLERPTRGDVDASSADVLILLDGELYRNHMPTVRLVEEWQRARADRTLWTSFVAQGEQPARWRDLQCSEPFAAFVADELVDWVVRTIDRTPRRLVLGGLSLGGLQAAFTALRYPSRFDATFCQSPSFWWSNARFADDVREAAEVRSRFRISCGRDETESFVDHGPGLVQRMSQLEGCQLVRDAFLARGADVSYEEITGGHEYATWTREFPDCLDFAFGS